MVENEDKLRKRSGNRESASLMKDGNFREIQQSVKQVIRIVGQKLISGH